jgi:hypothetical protein
MLPPPVEQQIRRVTIALAAALFSASTALAFSGGIATTSFPLPAQGCNFCHNGGSMPTLVLECADCGGAPPEVLPLSTHEFVLTVFETGLQDRAGLNVSSLLGTLATGGTFAVGTQAVVGAGGRNEITHTAPKLAAGGFTEFSFLWTAPAAPGDAVVSAWGNAVNGDGSTAGDAASNAMLVVDVVGDVPTATATVTPSPDVDTPTATPSPPAGCPATVDVGCTGGFASGMLLVREDKPGKEKLVARFSKGPALVQTDMGNPLAVEQGGTGTAYALCLYDDGGNLAGDVLVARAGETCDDRPCWRPVGRAPNDPKGPGRGYKYKDGALAADGVRVIRYKGGDAGKSKASLTGKGAGLPDGIAAALQTSSQVTVQLRSTDGVCLSVDLADIKVQEPAAFKAR